MRHKNINAADLLAWLDNFEQLYATAGTSDHHPEMTGRKRLVVAIGRRHFTVTANDVEVYSGNDAEKAVEVYNSIS